MYAIPASFIQSILDARKQDRYHGLGYFHFYWQGAQNPASLARLEAHGRTARRNREFRPGTVRMVTRRSFTPKTSFSTSMDLTWTSKVTTSIRSMAI